MWSYHQQDSLNDLDDLQEPTVGRALYVAGFVLGDPFDEFLKNISEDYLRTAWERLSAVLAENEVVADDLAWGWMHPGETGFLFEGGSPNFTSAPNDYIGWTSCDLQHKWRIENAWRSNSERRLDEILRVGKPAIRCTVTWRSLKWRISPTDFSLALRLIEAICVDEISDWHPNVVLQGTENPSELWRKFAKAIRDNDQSHLDSLLEQAEQEYSPLGLRILMRGYRTYVHGNTGYEGNITLPKIV